VTEKIKDFENRRALKKENNGQQVKNEKKELKFSCALQVVY